ncbi:MAG: HDOD domain-containing protein [Gammaproteobacteria bacterium]|nr:HDOD domain-containing protein [Gammaproteobacteria bacterium]
MSQVAETNLATTSDTLQPLERPTGRNDIFIARQPIFDNSSNVFAYELLFRSCQNNTAQVNDGSVASSQVILNAFVDMCIQEIAENRQVFVNFTREFLVGDIPLPLSSKSLVVEVLEDVEVDDAVVNGLQQLSRKGYTLALDDYIFTDDKEPLFDNIDIVKIDLLGCDISKLEPEIQALKDRNIKLLAEKVETQEEFEYCKQLGFDYYQGFYFCKPMILTGQSIKPNRLTVLQILSKLQDPNCDISELESLISKDVAISYKILRIINSAFYNFRREIKSVREAIVALGLKTIRDWMCIIVLTDIDDKPQELISQSLRRARMMQTLSEKCRLSSEIAFITGLFSSIDAIMDQPMDKILRQLPLADEIVKALTVREGEFGELLQSITRYERGEWDDLAIKGLGSQDLIKSYIESITWTTQLFSKLQD